MVRQPVLPTIVLFLLFFIAAAVGAPINGTDVVSIGGEETSSAFEADVTATEVTFADEAQETGAGIDSLLKSPQYRGKMTWFYPGLGACGYTDDSKDSIVALPSAKWNNRKNCNKKLVPQGLGKGVQNIKWQIL
ncbi:hypothetical protein FRC03_003085 [Tulasnella sp. 419]|nr:hypothetical protein FRC03_003085 [Tulasnella sp. 419]